MVLVLKNLFGICGRFVTVYFVLILPNVLGKNKFDVHENERVVETHFLYEWFHIGLGTGKIRRKLRQFRL